MLTAVTLFLGLQMDTSNVHHLSVGMYGWLRARRCSCTLGAGGCQKKRGSADRHTLQTAVHGWLNSVLLR